VKSDSFPPSELAVPLVLTRRYQNRFGVFGDLRDAKGEVICFTGERLWRDNAPNVSCIPDGEYWIERKKYGRFYQRYRKRHNHHHVFMLAGTAPRYEILFHKGNIPENPDTGKIESEGCILVGRSANPRSGVRSSKAAYCGEVYPALTALTAAGSVRLTIRSEDTPRTIAPEPPESARIAPLSEDRGAGKG